MNMSNELFQLAGFFDRYRDTGGTLSPQDAVTMSAKLTSLGEGVQQQGEALKSISDEFDRYVEDQMSDLPHVPAREIASLTVIEGGRC